MPESCSTPLDDDCDGEVNDEGPDCLCAPGSILQCYSGPFATIGVGVCKTGVQTCVTGTGYSACVGEVPPTTESCGNNVDDDCDDQLDCPGDFDWFKSFETSSGDFINPVLSRPDGKAHVVKVLAHQAKVYDASGTYMSTLYLNGINDIFLGNRPGSNSFFVAGRYTGTPSVSGSPLPAGDEDLMLGRFELAANTQMLALRGYPEGTAKISKTKVTADPAEDAYVVGQFQGVFDIGVGSTPMEGNSVDFFLAKLAGGSTPFGNPVWSRRLAAPGETSGAVTEVIATSAAGSLINGGIVVTGRYVGPLDFGKGPLPDPGAGSGTFLVRFDSSGSPVWSSGFVSITQASGTVEPIALATLMSSSLVALAGNAKATVVAGGVTIVPGAYVLLVDAATGSLIWVKSVPECSASSVTGFGTKLLMSANCPQSVDVGFGAVVGGSLFGLKDSGEWLLARGLSTNVTTYAVTVAPSQPMWPILFGTINGPAEFFPLGTKSVPLGYSNAPFLAHVYW